MINWLIGLNGAGKTVLLEEALDKEISCGKGIITNIREVHYNCFDVQKLDALEQAENFADIFDYGELKIINNKLAIINNDFNYTEQFLDILTLLCREGDTLILDEPEFGLFGIEIDLLAQILQILIPFYSTGYIATHCQELLMIQPNNFYWCDKYKMEKITEEELYGHIGKF